MKIGIVGAGIIGLTLARAALKRYQNSIIDIIDSTAIPSIGTSRRNSGVLHAGLYYEPESLKARLCKQGTRQLEEFINYSSLPLLTCGKILVPTSARDYINLERIKEKADSNKCETHYINHEQAEKIQPGIGEREHYLWSPRTKVFSPSRILNKLFDELQQKNVNFIVQKVDKINSFQREIVCQQETFGKYDIIFNVAGPGSLELYQNDTLESQDLKLLPILGQYAYLVNGPEIRTNVYPVPDPELPFLGVHITPQPDGLPLIGPNMLYPASRLR